LDQATIAVGWKVEQRVQVSTGYILQFRAFLGCCGNMQISQWTHSADVPSEWLPCCVNGIGKDLVAGFRQTYLIRPWP